MKKIFVYFFILSCLFFYNISVNAKCGTIRIGDFDWDSANFHAALVSYILEKDYGCNVEITKKSTAPIMADLFDGQLDIILETWEDNLYSLIQPEIKNGSLKHLGTNNVSVQGFFIDRKSAEKYNLRTIADMRDPKIAKLFGNKLISCISGWTCYTINYVKLKEYGLDKLYDNFDPVSGRALDEAISSAFTKGTPIFSYYWTPTSLMGHPGIDLVRLREPVYDADCWQAMSVIVENIKSKGVKAYRPSCASAYQDMDLTKIATTKFARANPDIIEFLQAYSVPTEKVNEMLYNYAYVYGGDMREVAKDYYQKHNRIVTAWFSGQEGYIEEPKKDDEIIIVDNNSTEEKLKKLKNLFDKDLITKNEYEKKRREILGLEDPVIQETVIATSDRTGPEIIVSKTFQANKGMIANINGRVKDDSKIVSLTIDGDQVAFTNGAFNQTLYVLPNGQDVEIVAIDKFGNQSKKNVTLRRPAVQTQTVSFAKLNPLAIKAPLNNNAVALIIGVEEYENTFKAMYAKQDALFFNDFAHQAFGVPRYRIKLLTNSGARRNDTLKTIATWLPKVIKENKTDFYLFFSGHGLASDNGKDLFLLPYDGYPEILEESSLLRNKIFDSIGKLKPRSVTVFLDTCYSGATRSEEMLVAARPIFIEVEEQDIPNNFTVFSASSGKETAKVLKEAEHGLFSYYMMKGLEGEADANSDQQITNGELIAFINKNVSRQAKQTPQLAGDASRILVQW